MSADYTVGIKLAALRGRITAYFNSKTFADATKASPDIATPRARYEPKKVWEKLKAIGGFSEVKLKPFLTFPLDERWIYYETEHKWLNEARSEFGTNLDDNEFLITVPEPRKASETRPLFATTLVNLHVHERGSVVIPRETRGDDLLADRDANLGEPAWRALRAHFGLKGERRNDDARGLAGRFLRLALAILHAPAYQADHLSALSSDWAHLPIPKDARLFERLAELGNMVARLLSAHCDPHEQIIVVLGQERAAQLAQLRKLNGTAIRPQDLKVTVNYWGGAKGRWVARPFTADEYSLPVWGDRTGDLQIADGVYFANIPEAVWRYELAGYPVLKQWLGYRQADRRGESPLNPEERRWFKSMVQRIAALLALGARLDELYSAASENAFTAADLDIPR